MTSRRVLTVLAVCSAVTTLAWLSSDVLFSDTSLRATTELCGGVLPRNFQSWWRLPFQAQSFVESEPSLAPFSKDLTTNRCDDRESVSLSTVPLQTGGNSHGNYSSGHRRLEGQPDCGTLAQRLECLAHTHPVFHRDDRCNEWDCDPLTETKLPFFCCMQRFSRAEALQLVNHTRWYFIGDSTSRRTARHLAAMLNGEPFSDIVEHSTVTHHISVTVNTGKHVSSRVVSHWIPKISTLRDYLHGAYDGLQTPPPPTELFHPSDANHRKVFVLHYSTHDIVGVWKHLASNGQPVELEDVVNKLHSHTAVFTRAVSDSLRLLKKRDGVDPARDIFIFRLPIAQACDSYELINGCNSTTHTDIINNYVERLAEDIATTVQAEHTDVALLDVLSWTRSSDGYDRAVCTKADRGGTHFATDEGRLAYVQQVLHAVNLLAQGRPEWRYNVLNRCS
jgi:hypothetical protein